MRITALLLALALPPTPARAVYKNNDVGTSSGQFLKLGADARAAAMGQAVDAFAQDASAVYWNPAGLAGLTRRGAMLTHAIYHQSVFYDFIAYGQPLESVLGKSQRRRDIESNELGSVAVGLLYLNAGSIHELDNTGAATGEDFTPRDYAVMASWGAPITEHLDLGIGVKYVNSRIEKIAATGAADFGARFQFRLGLFPVALSLSAHNLGGNLKFENQADPLPVHFIGGYALHLTRNWALTGELFVPKDKAAYPAFGSELRLPFSRGSSASLRAGYNGRASKRELSTLSGVSAGGGVSLSGWSLDYAWTPFGILEDAHRFTFSFRF